MHKGLGFQPGRGEQRKFVGYCSLCWRIGHKEAQFWFKREYMKSNPPQDMLQRDIREWTNTSEKGQGHSQPKGKGQGKGTRLDLRMKKLVGARWVVLEKKNFRELNLVVVSRRMMILRLPDWIEQFVCFAFKSARVL